MVNYEKKAMFWLDRGKSDKIKGGQEVNNTEKIVKLVEGMNKYIPPQM